MSWPESFCICYCVTCTMIAVVLLIKELDP